MSKSIRHQFDIFDLPYNRLYELKFKSPAFRIYFAAIGKQILLLISGGNKSQQSKDIKVKPTPQHF